MKRHLLLTALLAASASAPGQAADPQFLISANDNKTTLIDGVQTVLPDAPPDTVSIYDASVTPPKLVAELTVPTSVVGPPQMVAIAPDRSIALVTARSNTIPPIGRKRFPMTW